MKILMLINGLYPEARGGVEKLGADIARLLARNHDVVVYTSHAKGCPAIERRDGFLIKRMKSSMDYNFKIPIGVRTISWLRALKGEMPKPDVVYSMSLSYGSTCYLFRKLFGIPFVVHALGTDWYIARGKRVSGKAFRLGIEKCNTMITQTSIIKNDVLGYFAETDIEVIPNGVAIPPVQRPGGNAIISLGRLDPVKGLGYLIDAVKEIERPPRLIIAGTGPEEGNLRSITEGMDVEFAGWVSDVGEVFGRGKIFVLPSLSEGLPSAMLEAMSYGLPVIATKVGGVPDIIEHGKTGFLIEPKDTAAIKKYIKLLLEDDATFQEMSRNCLKEIQKYSWDKTIGRIEDVMAKAAASGPSS